MRTLILTLIALFALPAFAAEWGHYDNARFGYGVDIPPGFSALGEADNGDGQVFRSNNGSQTLTVWGANIIDTDFSGDVDQRIAGDKKNGWDITYQATSPKWASWSGSSNGLVLYARAVALCDGTQAAYFALQYSKADIAKLDPVVNRLVNSLKGPNC